MRDIGGKKNPNWRGGRLRKCEQCEKKFWVTPWEAKKGRKFCSRECYGKWQSSNIVGAKNPNWKNGKQGKVKQICVQCKEEFWVKKSIVMSGKGKFCSCGCRSKFYNSGEGNPQWRGGISATYIKHLAGREWNKIRERCYKRDGYHCQKCGITTNLHAHHIIPWRILHDDSLENLITLCGKCHHETEWELRR